MTEMKKIKYVMKKRLKMDMMKNCGRKTLPPLDNDERRRNGRHVPPALLSALKFHEAKEHFLTGLKFTLLELLIVITIISILTCLLLPALNNAKKQSKRISCSSNLKQFGPAANMYVDDYGDYYPEKSTVWYLRLTANTKEDRLGNRPYGVGAGNWNCPSREDKQVWAGQGCCYPDYMFNYYITALSTYVGPSKGIALKVKQPASTYMMIDATMDGDIYLTSPSRIAYRHLNVANVLYCDGHMGWINSKQGLAFSSYSKSPFWYAFEE